MYKYSVILFNCGWPFLDNIQLQKIFDEQTYIFRGRFKDFEVIDDISFWKDWLGTTKWDEIERFDGLILFTFCESKSPEILDDENKALTDKLYDAYMILKVIDYVNAPHSAPFSFTGKTDQIILPNLRFIDVRETSSLKVWPRPYYFTSDEFLEWDGNYLEKRYVDYIVRWEKFFHQFRSWKSNPKKFKTWFQSYLAFQEAFKTNHLEFKMPNLVRACESILALPKGSGFKTFAKRALKYCSIDSNHPLINFSDLLGDLERLYAMRNDCSHGKPFGWSIDKNLKVEEDDINLDVARYEYLAETVARAIIYKSLNDPDLEPYLSDRDELEKYMQKYD